MSEAAARKLYCSRCLNTFEADLEQCPNLSCRRKRPARGWGVIFAEGDIFDRNYRIHKMLAVGGAGVTYLAREIDANGDEAGPRLAVKVLLAARDAGPYVRRLATEAQIIQELDHANIVQYLGFVHRAGHSPYLLTRFESGGSLLDHMRRVGTLSVRAAAVVGRQICWALEKAHERGIVHRDLKPENVLLTRVVPATEDPVVRVADFGIAKVQGSLNTNLTRVGAFVGTPHYAAPEQFVGGTVTEAADVYSVGALIYFCMMARHVARFADRLDPEEGFQLLCDQLPPVVERSNDDATAVERMNRVLAVVMRVDPRQRCSVVELDRMLEAVAAGREPELPLPEACGAAQSPAAVRAEAEVIAQRSALGLTSLQPTPAPSGGALVAVVSEPTMADDVGAEREAPTAATGVVRPEDATPVAQPKAPPPAAAPAPKKGRLGCVMLVLVGGLALFALALGGLGALWLQAPERVSGLLRSIGLDAADPGPTGAGGGQPAPKTASKAASPTVITSDSANAKHAKEHSLIASGLLRRKDWLAERCAVVGPVEVTAHLVVEANGGTRSASVTGGAAEQAACLSSEIKRLTHKRKLPDVVSLDVVIQWP